MRRHARDHDHTPDRGSSAGPAQDDRTGHPHPDTDPDHSGKIDSVRDLSKPAWTYVAKKTVREFMDDQCTDLAAALTYYGVLALFPAAIALTSLLGLVGQGTQSVKVLLDMVSDLGGGSMIRDIRGPLEQLATNQAAGLALILGLAGALWSASGYIGAFGRAMNRIYEIREGRPIWKLRPAMLLLTAVMVVLAALVTLGLVLTGGVAQTVGNRLFGMGDTALLIWNIAKWPALLVIVVLMVALLYYATPNVKQPKFRWISVGATLAIVTWILLSAAFGFYLANFGSYDKTYGALAGVIAFLLWLWLTNIALLFGAELDAELERGRELQSGLPAEETIQLPPRDTRNIEKAEKKEAKEIATARELRQQNAAIVARSEDDDVSR